MTEKVVSLSGGLVLGMVCALFLGIGATQSLAPSVHFEIPSILQMTIAQNTHNTPTPANDTTPSINVTTPSNGDRGRITRIATLTETSDHVFTTTATTTQTDPKNWEITSTPKIDNTLQRVNLQRSYIAASTQTSTYITLGQAARQSNFTAIAGNSSRNGGYGSQPPSFIDGKPGSSGSPAVAQNNPETGESEDNPHGGGPAITGDTPKPPKPRADTVSNTNTGEPPNPVRSSYGFAPDNGGHSENDPGNPMLSQRNRRRPATD